MKRFWRRDDRNRYSVNDGAATTWILHHEEGQWLLSDFRGILVLLAPLSVHTVKQAKLWAMGKLLDRVETWRLRIVDAMEAKS